MSKRFLLTLLTIILIAIVGGIAIFAAKGYRLSPQTGTISGTGILSVTSKPDQASVYLDGHLTTATDENINSLTPKTYTVRIVKDGYIPWEKQVEVKEGLVTEIKASLFRSIPTVYPLTYTGANNLLISPDDQKLVYVVPENPAEGEVTNKKAGIWIWQMGTEGTINFGRGNEPRQISVSSGTDFTKAKFRWSPDSTQILATLEDRQLLLDVDKFNDPARDITAVAASTIKNWDDSETKNKQARLQLIKDATLRKTASSSASIKWSPDETKILYKLNEKEDYKVTDLTTNKTYQLPKASNYSFLADSEHLIMLEYEDSKPEQAGEEEAPNQFTQTKISMIEVDGFNKSEIYVGNIDTSTVFSWPDSSKIVVISSLPTLTASKPNLYGINLK